MPVYIYVSLGSYFARSATWPWGKQKERLTRLHTEGPQGAPWDLTFRIVDLIHQEQEAIQDGGFRGNVANQGITNIDLLRAIQKHHYQLDTVTVQDKELSGADVDFERGHLYLTIGQSPKELAESHQSIL